MNRLLRNRTPAQLGWIIAVANLLVASSFAAFFVDSYRHPTGHRLSALAACTSFALLILGLAVELFAETALKDGIVSEQWPEALVTTTRKIFTHPALSAASLLLIVAGIAVVVFSGRHFVGVVWIFLLPSMSLTRIRGFFSQPRKDAGGLGSIDPPKPLQSEQWGTPPQSFTN
jgi:hypothetical protein